MMRIHLFEGFRLRALGTNVLVCSSSAESLEGQVRSFLEECEQRFSRFRTDSEVERLSQQAGDDAIVSDDLFELLEVAATYWQETGGIFDPLIRSELEAAGYDRTFERVAAAMDGPVPRPPACRPTFGEVVLNSSSRTVRLPEGSRLDLGGIAKGWIVDRVADLLEPHGPFLVDIGGDIVAHGEGPDGGFGWLIGVADPVTLDSDRRQLRLDGRAIATSTTQLRRWRRGRCWQHHLIDPRTGRPAESDLVQVTVVAPTALEGDVCAKTALILGREDGRAWLTRRRLPALLLGRTATTSTPQWRLEGLPER